MPLTEFERGAWSALDAVLHWINTQTEQKVDKGALYKHVMGLRPSILEQK